ncbi:LCP family protein [Clostridium fungisolvens]|uniref:Polyisoprenyl-teichoic acid--peptidoglycan teichoic acid transferase TagU n=1 Tax=Clostridium fungisolvens TaxID=1604897 RepID=A0A6V8SHE8_9CLOT|nr:LCP family protein [Clostridium fungisolvens]GFP74313.1 Polyisoprenyl-teichoic acid--peptidoglycan teichoic acid transferase TagU [Clostridium fungisolvens]
MGKRYKKKVKKPINKKKRVLIVATVVIIIIGLVIGIPYYMLNRQLSKIHKAELPTNIGIDNNSYLEKNKELQDNYINILLMGVDSRAADQDARSDSMMIATIDKKHNKIKLASLMRDMIVDMTGHGPMEGLNQDRLTHAYEYGKAELTLKTVNENFKMNIKNFVEVDFFGLEKIIDQVGGVEINVTSEEVPYLNAYVKEVAGIEKVTPKLVTKPGLQLLDGKQAVGYARIRYVGNMDFQRTERQRTVLTKVLEKLSSMNPLQLNNAIGEMLPNVTTSMDRSDIISLSKDVLLKKINKVEQLRIPIDGHNGTIYVRNTYFLGWDKKENLEALHKFIYEEDYNEESIK